MLNLVYTRTELEYTNKLARLAQGTRSLIAEEVLLNDIKYYYCYHYFFIIIVVVIIFINNKNVTRQIVL